MNDATSFGQADIDQAKMLAQWANGRPEHDSSRAYERLYRTKDGHYFLVMQHGAQSAKVVPCTPEEARQWTEQHSDAMTLQRLFG